MNIEVKCGKCGIWMTTSAVNLTWIRCERCHNQIDISQSEIRTHLPERHIPTKIESIPNRKRKDYGSSVYGIVESGTCANCKDPININAFHIKKEWRGKELLFCCEKCRRGWVRKLMKPAPEEEE